MTSSHANPNRNSSPGGMGLAGGAQLAAAGLLIRVRRDQDQVADLKASPGETQAGPGEALHGEGGPRKHEHIGCELARMVFGSLSFADVRQWLRGKAGATLFALQTARTATAVQILPRPFGAGNRFPSRIKFCQEPVRGFSKSLKSLSCSAVRHAQHVTTGAKAWRTQIEGIRNP